MKTYPPFLTLVSAFAAFVNISSAAVIADFSGGNGTASSDQYLGTAGSGWSGPWSQPSQISGTVTNANPLDGGGNYLQAILGSNAASVFYISRQWDNSNVSYTADSITISWQFRLDSSLTVFNAVEDQIGFQEGSGAGSTFLITAFGANYGTSTAKTWAFYNGAQNGAAFNQNNYVNTGIALVSGTVYDFSVTLDPLARTWIGTVSNGVNSYTSPTPLGFRTSAFSANGNVQFGMRESALADNLTFSLDSIAIVPEPNVLGLAFMGFAGCVIFFRRCRPCRA